MHNLSNTLLKKCQLFFIIWDCSSWTMMTMKRPSSFSSFTRKKLMMRGERSYMPWLTCWKDNMHRRFNPSRRAFWWIQRTSSLVTNYSTQLKRKSSKNVKMINLVCVLYYRHIYKLSADVISSTTISRVSVPATTLSIMSHLIWNSSPVITVRKFVGYVTRESFM